MILESPKNLCNAISPLREDDYPCVLRRRPLLQPGLTGAPHERVHSPRWAMAKMFSEQLLKLGELRVPILSFSDKLAHPVHHSTPSRLLDHVLVFYVILRAVTFGDEAGGVNSDAML